MTRIRTLRSERRHLASASALMLLSLAAIAQAQTAPQATPTTTEASKTGDAAKPAATKLAASSDDEAVIELTPFQVDASKDNGYYSPNTLSGTRLNSKVQDLGSSITVITKAQLDDTAAVDINDVFKYEANTEGMYNYTAISSSSPTSDMLQGGNASSGGAALATRVRGISAPNITEDYFTHTARIPIDSFFVESMELSRGPNSSVAGLGSPSGTINYNLKNANVTRDSNTIQFRLDSYGGNRSAIDVNRKLWKDKLAIRVAYSYTDTEFKQKPSYDYTKRALGAITFRPFKSLTIHAKAESYREDRQSPNSLTPRDGVSEWIAAGKPTWNPLTWTATTTSGNVVLTTSQDNTTAFPNGLYVNTTTYTRPSMFIDHDVMSLWMVNRLATTANPNATTTSNVRMLSSGSAYMRGRVNSGTLYTTPGISNKALYDWTNTNSVPENWNWDKAGSYTVDFEQKIVENLYLRGAWHLEDSVEYNRNVVSSPTLQVDVNQYLLDGTANPYFLRPYISAVEPSIYRLPEYNDAKQLALSYSYDFTKKNQGWMTWLGSHQLGLNWEHRTDDTGTYRYREAVIDPNHVWLTAGALNYTNGSAIGRPTYQYYVGPTGATGYTSGYVGPMSGAIAGQYNLRYYNGATSSWVNDPAQFGTANYVSSISRAETTTRAYTYQGNFLKDRLVVTGGYRKDKYRTRNSLNGAVDDVNTGFYSFDTLKVYGPWTNSQGPTDMISFVAYPLKNRVFGLTFSKSSSFQPQAQAVDLFGNVLPNTYGHDRTMGFFVNLIGNKLVLSVKNYKTDINNDRTSNTTLGTRIARIEAGVDMNGTTSDTFSLYNFAETVAKNRLGAGASQSAIDAEAFKITNWSSGFVSALNSYASGAAIRGTADTAARGDEVELAYNPSNNWAIKLSGTKTEAINKTIENNLQNYIDSRMAYWTSVKDDSGNAWWTSTALSTTSAQSWYQTNVVVPLKLDQALLGKSNPQVKKYSFRALSTYNIDHGFLKNYFVGGAARWDDRSVIGYLAGAADSDGVVRTLDVNKPFYDPARWGFDAWVGYNVKLFHNKVKARIQLNANNFQEKGGLRTVGVNPDGTPYNFRIINPRQFVLTTTFEF